jgi:hypothetical protein
MAGFLVHEDGERNAPSPLPRHAPIGTILDHGADAIAALIGEEFGVGNGLDGRFAQAGLFHGYKPLSRIAVNQRGFGSPGMGIGMFQLAVVQQGIAFLHGLDHRLGDW